jgi:hypothetical protein
VCEEVKKVTMMSYISYTGICSNVITLERLNSVLLLSRVQCNI